MRRIDHCPSALDLFWEDADLNDSSEHPLRRELAHRLDVVQRYQRLIAEAQSDGPDDLLANLTQQHDRQLRVIERLEAALHRHETADDGAPHDRPQRDTLSIPLIAP